MIRPLSIVGCLALVLAGCSQPCLVPFHPDGTATGSGMIEAIDTGDCRGDPFEHRIGKQSPYRGECETFFRACQ